MSIQFFSFGCGHTFANKYVEIHADTKEKCREVMFNTFGERWSMQYDTDDSMKAHGMDKMAKVVARDGSAVKAETYPTISVS